MTALKYMIIFLNLFFLLNSCTQKNPHATGGFQDTFVSKNNQTGFDSGNGQQVPDLQFLYLKGCYTGQLQGIDDQYMSIYIDTRGLDLDGWSENGIMLGLKGNFVNSFNITSNECIRFTNPVTSQIVEYFRDEYGNLGANISAELHGLISGQIEPGYGSNNCVLYGKPIRLDLRLIFETPEVEYENNQIKKTQVNRILSGSYILYYANIQKAYSRNADERSLNPKFCCSEESNNSTAWSEFLGQNPHLCREITLDKVKDLSYFMGVLPSTKTITLDPTCSSIINNCNNQN